MSSGQDHFIAGQWIRGTGPDLVSTDPATRAVLWQGHEATPGEVDCAVHAARAAVEDWSNLPLPQRIERLQAFAEQLRSQRTPLAQTISQETGKPRWEALGEVDSMIAKVGLSIEAFNERCAGRTVDGGEPRALVRYKPHGVLAVFGPYNLPGHLPNGHIVPALLAGNTIVFKPSEQTPLVAQRTVELWHEAGLPVGVLNLVQGGRETGRALAEHPGIDGLLFTGSVAAGVALHRAMAGHPEKLLALEMGGNNPLIVWEVRDVRAAVYMTIQSAFVTSGQRCSCARRLIVEAGPTGDHFVEHLAAAIEKIRVGPWADSPEPFMGPVISARAAAALLNAQEDLRQRSGTEIVPMRSVEESTHVGSALRTTTPHGPQCGPYAPFLRPGLMDVSAIPQREDTEHFGPFLQLIRVADFDAAVREANNTTFGLCAGLLSDRRDLYEQFHRTIRAGVVNWNRPTTGASSRLPFGGLGASGNHRPSGYYACDYCADPIASLEMDRLTMPSTLSPGIDL